MYRVLKGYFGFRDWGLGGFPEFRGPFLRGLHNKDFSALGSILESPYFGKPTGLLMEASFMQMY